MLVGHNLIGDVAVAPAAGLAVVDPATGSTVGLSAQASLADADAAVAHAIAKARDRGQASGRQDEVGHGLDPATTMGPVNNPQQLERVQSLPEAGLRDGGKPVAGGKRLPGAGNFHQPTIVSDVDPGSVVVEEEQFGPVLPLVAYDDLDQAIDWVERGPYGLGGSVWSSDGRRAGAVARRITSGMVWANHHLESRPDVLFGGTKASGIGSENGVEVLAGYSRPQIIGTWRG